jgi:hypothetical protein
MCPPDGPESVRSESDGMARCVAGSNLSRDGLRTEDEVFAALQKVCGELDMSVTTGLVARFSSRLEMDVDVRGNTISQLQSSHRSPRPHGVWEGEIALFTPEDDLPLGDRVESLGRHWKRIADEVEFSSPRTELELGMRYDCLEGEERNELAMLLKRKYINVDRPLDGMLVVGFPAGTREDAELARVRAPDWESGDDDEYHPRYAPASPGFLAFSLLLVSPCCARLALSGLSGRLCEPFAATGSALKPRTGTSGPSRGRRHQRARGGRSHASVPGGEGMLRWLAWLNEGLD